MIALIVAVYWMVREWINSRYAFIAAFIVMIRYGLFGFWANSYWDGAFTALGGVLLVGGFKAIMSRPNLSNGSAVGLGAAILMTTRPYEGMFFAFPLGASLVLQFVRSTRLGRKSLIPSGLAAAALVAGGFGLTFAHNEAVTGDWKVEPYSLYRQTVAEAPAFLLESRSPQRDAPARYAGTRFTLDIEAKAYDRRATWGGILSAETFRFRNYWNFFVGFALLIPFVVGVYTLRSEPALLLAAASLGVGLSFLTWGHAHYAAPGFGFVILAIMDGFRRLRQWRPWACPYGLWVSRLLPLALVIGSVIPLSSALTGWPTFTMLVNIHDSTPCCWLRPRSLHMAVEDEVDRDQARNLVIVDTGPKAPIDAILVSNGPDIDDEQTIWVNDDAEFNRLAIDRYPVRRIWRLGWLDDGAACLQPFEAVSSLADPSGDSGRLSADQERGWLAGSPGRCPAGLVHAPFVGLK